MDIEVTLPEYGTEDNLESSCWGFQRITASERATSFGE
jgi:hypothetical protein